MKQLDPKAIWLFFFSYLAKWFFIVIFLGFYMLFSFTRLGTSFSFWSVALGMTAVIIVAMIILYVFAQLTYGFYRYELTENTFKKEYGIIWKRYVSIPYDRIQNVDIFRGILARIFGLSDLHIQTAGMSVPTSGGLGGYAEGRLPGLAREDAEKLRDELIARARQSKNQGL